ncbi:MAG: hypothetical protein ABSB33_10855, partial [Tepidisphaeraceae bacterium]
YRQLHGRGTQLQFRLRPRLGRVAIFRDYNWVRNKIVSPARQKIFIVTVFVPIGIADSNINGRRRC